jgi:hypothetical protein
MIFFRGVVFLFACFFLFFSCKKDDPIDDAGVVQFTNSNKSVHETSSSLAIDLKFSAPLKASGVLVVSINDSTATYGKEYVTSPDGSSKLISIPLTKGATQASFTIIPLLNSSTDGDKVVKFTIDNRPNSINLGELNSQKVTIIDDDLVCYLLMNGNAKDLSNYHNTTSVEYATLTTGRAGLPNSAYLMNGYSNDIVISNSKVLDTIKNQITLAAWFKPTVSYRGNGNNAIIEKAYKSHINPYYQYKLGITGDQYPYLAASFLFSLSINSTYNVAISPANTWSVGSWYFIVGTYDGKQMKLYVNGNLVATEDIVGQIDSWGTDIYLGKINNLNLYTQGVSGDIRIYNRALSATEVLDLYGR